MLILLTLHLRHKWAVLRRDHLRALKHMETIIMIDFSKLQAAAVADAQAQVDAITATLEAQIAPPAAPAA
jgi:hypothetical protein